MHFSGVATKQQMMDPNRLYQRDDEHWYFNVRGNHAVGPFITHHEASQALSSHVDNCRQRVEAKPSWPRGLNLSRLLRRSNTDPRNI
jgi:hypothetical protein